MSRMTAELIISLIDRVTAPSRAVNAAVDRLTSASRRNAAAMNAARGQMMDAIGMAYALGRALGAPISAATEFESAMADIAKVAGFDDAGLSDFGKQLRALSTGEIPMAVTELAALAAGGAQGGVADADLLGFTEIAAKVAVAWDMAGEVTGDSLAHIKTALGLTVPELGLFADAINYLSNETASSAPQLVDYSERVAAQGEFYGYAKEETLAFGTAMISAGADSNVAATSFRAMGRALTRGESATTAQRKAMKRLGLDTKKVAARMQKDAVGTTLDVLRRIGELPKEIQAATMTDIFGDEARALAPLLGNLDELQRVLGLVNDEKNYFGSAQAEFEKRSKTFENSVNKLNAQLNDLSISIGSALLPPLTDLMDIVGPVIMAMSEWATAHPDLIKNIIAIGSALLGFRIATIAARYLFLFMKGGVIDLALAFTKSAAVIVAGAGRVGAAMAGMRAAMVGATMMSAIGGGGLLAPLVAGIAAIAAAPIWLILAIVAAIAALGLVVHKYWEPISNFFAGVGEGIAQAAAEIGNAVGSFAEESLINIGKLFGVDPAVMQAAIDEAKADIKAAWDSMVTFLWELPGQVGNWMGGIWEMDDYSDEEEASFKDRGLRAVQMMVESAKSQMANYGGGLQLVFDLVTGNIDPLIAKLQTDPLWQATVNFWQGSIDPFIQWLWDIAHNGLKIAVDIGKSIGDAVNGITGGGTPAAAGAGGGGWGVPAKAAGGVVLPNTPYLVGELGPELFVPGTSGTVVTAARTARMLSDIPLGTGRFANDNAANGNSGGGPVSVTFSGDIIVQGGANASADDIADAIGRKVSAQVSGYFSDGGY